MTAFDDMTRLETTVIVLRITLEIILPDNKNNWNSNYSGRTNRSQDQKTESTAIYFDVVINTMITYATMMFANINGALQQMPE